MADQVVFFQSDFQIGVLVNRTRMTRIERIDPELIWFYPRLSAPVRVIRVPLTPSLQKTPIADPYSQ